MDADGSRLEDLSHNGANDWSPAWSPDRVHASRRYLGDASGRLQSARTENDHRGRGLAGVIATRRQDRVRQTTAAILVASGSEGRFPTGVPARGERQRLDLE